MRSPYFSSRIDLDSEIPINSKSDTFSDSEGEPVNSRNGSYKRNISHFTASRSNRTTPIIKNFSRVKNNSQFVSNVSMSDVNYLYPELMQSPSSYVEEGIDNEPNFREEFLILMKKYKQIKEELKVQKQLFNSREDRERTLQDQLNKVTIELAQLRLVREDLAAALNQEAAKNSYLSNELNKIGQKATSIEDTRFKEVQKIKEEMETNKRQIEAEKNNYELKYQKLRAKNKELKILLSQSKRQMSHWQDENFKLSNENQSISSKYEMEKLEFLRSKQGLKELQIRFDKASKDLQDLKLENEHLNTSLQESQNQMQTLLAENRRFSRERSILNDQINTLNKQLDEVNKSNIENQIKMQKSYAKLSAMQDENEQNKELLQKTRNNYTNDINNLKLQIASEKETSAKLRNDHLILNEQLSELKNELELEKNGREKLESLEKTLRQRLAQFEALSHDGEEERKNLNIQLNEINRQLNQKDSLIESTQEKLKAIMNENLELKQVKKELENKLEKFNTHTNNDDGEISDIKRKFDDALSEKSTLEANIKMQQIQIKELQSKVDLMTKDKEDNKKLIEELQESLKKESESLRKRVQEQQEIQNNYQTTKNEYMELKKKMSKYDTFSSMSKTEKDFMQKQLKEKQEMINESNITIQRLQNERDTILSQLRTAQSTSSLYEQENEKQKSLNNKLKSEITQSKTAIKSFQNKIDFFEKQNSSLEEANQHLSQKIEKLNTTIDDLTQQSNLLRQKIIYERSEKEKYVQTIHEYENEIEITSNALKNTEKQLESTKNQLSVQLTTINDLNIQITQLKSINDHINHENDILTNDKNHLMSKINNFESQNGSNNIKEDAGEKHSNLDDQINKLTNSNRTLSDMLAEAEMNYKETKIENSKLKEMIDKLQNEIGISHEGITSLNNKIYDFQRQISELKASDQSKEIQNNEQNVILSQLKNENKVLREQNSILEDKINSDKLQLETNYLNNLEALKQKHKEEIAQRNIEDSTQKEKILGLSQDIAKKRQEIINLETTLNTYSMRMKTLETQLESSNKHKEELINENSNLKAELLGNIQKCNHLDKLNKKINKDRNKLIDKITSLSTENDRLSTLKNDCYAANVKLEQSESMIRQLQSQVITLSSLNESLSIEVAEAQKSRYDATNEFQRMTQTMQNIHSLLSKNDLSTSDVLEVMDLDQNYEGSKNFNIKSTPIRSLSNFYDRDEPSS